MKPNGYQYAYRTPKACERCFDKRKEGGRGNQYRLFAYNGKKICRNCAREVRVL